MTLDVCRTSSSIVAEYKTPSSLPSVTAWHTIIAPLDEHLKHSDISHTFDYSDRTMSSFTYHHTRTRSRTPPPLPRRTSFKRQRLFPSDSDDEYDDYPYSGAHRPSRALATRNAPSQLERWNIWSSPDREVRSERVDSGTEDANRSRERESERRVRRVSFADRDDVDADEERAFQLRIAHLRSRERERLSPVPGYRAESDDERVSPRTWGAEVFRRSRERCVSEEFERRERVRGASREQRSRERLWGDGDGVVERQVDGERVVRYRRVKRTRTDEWRPLSGFRRS